VVSANVDLSTQETPHSAILSRSETFFGSAAENGRRAQDCAILPRAPSMRINPKPWILAVYPGEQNSKHHRTGLGQVKYHLDGRRAQRYYLI